MYRGGHIYPHPYDSDKIEHFQEHLHRISNRLFGGATATDIALTKLQMVLFLQDGKVGIPETICIAADAHATLCSLRKCIQYGPATALEAMLTPSHLAVVDESTEDAAADLQFPLLVRVIADAEKAEAVQLLTEQARGSPYVEPQPQPEPEGDGSDIEFSA
eukprot:TRINITY_DN62_c0_g1_i1.p1 TRINITY_DN62_c0_g1~~TRINITY_DN62_c0_g1_i1.p1  ORF type:complete len:161 (+),score=19.25 TRINITY_DN62_c0_g1_i1:280-762(+)